MTSLSPAGAGYSRSGAGLSQTVRFPVSGMTCGSCAVHIVKALRPLPGVSAVKVDLRHEAVTVRRDPSIADDAILSEALAAVGYQAHLEAATLVADTGTRGFLTRLFER